tara:strand:+ start:115 stop:759 length:645 start_codon:yes stop_codon:yes gene_type:complete
MTKKKPYINYNFKMTLKMKFYTTLFFILIFSTFSIFSQEKKDIDTYRNEGFFNITRIGIIPLTNVKSEIRDFGLTVTTLPTNKAIAYSFNTINGYFFSPNFSLGIGIGLDGYHNPNANTMPLFADVRYYFNDEAKSVYVFADVGSLIKIENGTRRGSMINLGMGYKFPINKKRFFLVSDISLNHKSISLDGLKISKSTSVIRATGIMISLGVIF